MSNFANVTYSVESFELENENGEWEDISNVHSVRKWVLKQPSNICKVFIQWSSIVKDMYNVSYSACPPQQEASLEIKSYLLWSYMNFRKGYVGSMRSKQKWEGPYKKRGNKRCGSRQGT